MPKKVKVAMIVVLDDDADGKKAEKLRAKLLKKSLKRKDKDGNVVADIEIDEDKGKPKKVKP